MLRRVAALPALLLTALLIALPAIAAAPHSGTVRRTGFEPADAAMFAAVAAGIWFARRALRARFRQRRD